MASSALDKVKEIVPSADQVKDLGSKAGKKA
jgi:hypothetical protein